MLEGFLYASLSFLPGLFWMWFYLRKDRDNPEPLSLIMKVFFLGMAATIPAIALQFTFNFFFNFTEASSLTAVLITAFLIVSPIEEILKFLVIREFVFKNKNFNEPVDGVMYAIVAALGFATLENILAVLSTQGGGEVVLIRSVTATLMHALATGIVGYHIGLGFLQKSKRRSLIIQGIIIAIVLHALYNMIIAISSNVAIALPLLILLLGAMFVIVHLGIKELKNAAK